MNKAKIHSFFLIIICFGIQSCSQERESVKVDPQDIVESVYTSVTIDPATMYKVNSTLSGLISSINFDVGDKVNIGDVIFQIHDIQGNNTASNSKLNYQAALKNYSGEQNMLDDLRLEIENVSLKRNNDSLNNTRNSALFEKSLISDVEMEQSKILFNSSKNAHITLINKLKRLERDLKLSVEQAKNNYNSSLSRSKDAFIASKIDGIIYEISKEQEELVAIQETIAIIGSEDSFVLKMLIDEVDITKVKIGQKIIVSLEAYTGKVYEGVVKRIAPKMDTRTQTFEIEGEFTNPPDKLYMGLTGEGNILINKRENVLVIPLEYLVDGDKVETDDGLTKVTIGVRSLSHVEILSGIKKGDIIYKPL